MASFKALCLAGVASLAAMAGANAADLLPPPPPVYAPPPPPVAFGGAWYIRGDTGLAINDLRQQNSRINPAVRVPGLRYDTANLDDAAVFDVGLGYRFNEFFRADVTVGYHSNTHYSAIESYQCAGNPQCRFTPRGYDYYSGSVRSVHGLVNGYVNSPRFYGASVWAGAGVGASYVGFGQVTDQGASAAAGGFGFSQSRWTTNFAFALMAGVDFAVTQNLTLELGYRYLNQGSIATGTIRCTTPGVCPNESQRFKLASNDIRLGFRYAFADFVPAFAPSMPLVRKY